MVLREQEKNENLLIAVFSTIYTISISYQACMKQKTKLSDIVTVYAYDKSNHSQKAILYKTLWILGSDIIQDYSSQLLCFN